MHQAMLLSSLLFLGFPGDLHKLEDLNSCEHMSLCPLAVSDHIRPLDGNWALSLQSIQRTGSCLSQVVVIIEPMISGLSIANPVVWSDTFHPKDLRIDRNSRRLVWRMDDSGAFYSERVPTQSSIVETKYSARLIDDSTIAVNVVFFLDDSPNELGMKDCVIEAALVATHVGLADSSQ